MTTLFYLAGAVAVVATLMVITRAHAVHALLYLIVSLLAIAVVFYTLGAPFVAALEVIIYAGAIMVLFVFAIMILNLGPAAGREERRWLSVETWAGPAVLSLLIFGDLMYVLTGPESPTTRAAVVSAQAVGVALFGPYVVGVELASLILLAGLVAAYHLGRRARVDPRTSDTPSCPREGAGGGLGREQTAGYEPPPYSSEEASP